MIAPCIPTALTWPIFQTNHPFSHLCLCNSICREELEALSEITHQINHHKLNQANGDINSNVAHQQSNESVDLDNLFAFLSEVTPNNSSSSNHRSQTADNCRYKRLRRFCFFFSFAIVRNKLIRIVFVFFFCVFDKPKNSIDNTSNSNNSSSTVSINNNTSSIIDDIEETFHDLDVELENVLQQEMEGLAIDNERTTGTSGASNKGMANAKMGVPSLPEPTTRPPPPPSTIYSQSNQRDSNNSTMGLNCADLTTEVIPLNKPPQVPCNSKVAKRKEEPIYEAVIPRHELPSVAELPEPIPSQIDMSKAK